MNDGIENLQTQIDCIDFQHDDVMEEMKTIKEGMHIILDQQKIIIEYVNELRSAMAGNTMLAPSPAIALGMKLVEAHSEIDRLKAENNAPIKSI